MLTRRNQLLLPVLIAFLMAVLMMAVCTCTAHAEAKNLGTVEVAVGDGDTELDGDEDEAVYWSLYYMADEGSIARASWYQGFDLDKDGNVDLGYTATSLGKVFWSKYRDTNITDKYELEVTDTAKAKMIDNDHTYCDKIIWDFDPEFYLVEFDTRGGTEIQSQQVIQGGKASVPENPQRTEENGWGYFAGWYADPALTREFDFSQKITGRTTIYAKWYYGLSVGTYDLTADASDYKCGSFSVQTSDTAYPDKGYAGNCNMTLMEGSVTVKAYSGNGYKFVGWYEGNYIGGSDQDMEPIDLEDPSTLLSSGPEYTFTLSGYTCIIPVFEKAPEIHFVDIGNIWTKLDPLNEVPFTAETNPDVDGLSDFIGITDEKWASEGGDISMAGPGTPVVGNKYSYSVTISAKGDNVFVPAEGFRFINGGTEYEWADITVDFSDDNKNAVISGFVSDITVEKIDIKDAVITGVKDKTYNGKAQTQVPAASLSVNGTDAVLRADTDYEISYSKNTNAGKASVILTGKGIFTGTAEKTFTIKKAANPLKIKARTATVKYSKLKKKTQTLKVTKVIKFTKKLSDKKTYTLSYAKKGKKSFKKYFKINKTSGKVTVKKGLKKGSYKIKVKVKASGNSNYKASGKKSVTFTVKVK